MQNYHRYHLYVNSSIFIINGKGTFKMCMQIHLFLLKGKMISGTYILSNLTKLSNLGIAAAEHSPMKKTPVSSTVSMVGFARFMKCLFQFLFK